MCKEGFQVLEGMKEGHIFSVPFLYLKTCCTSSLDRWPHLCLCEACKEPLGGAGRDAEAELPGFLFCSPPQPLWQSTSSWLSASLPSSSHRTLEMHRYLTEGTWCALPFQWLPMDGLGKVRAKPQGLTSQHGRQGGVLHLGSWRMF